MRIPSPPSSPDSTTPTSIRAPKSPLLPRQLASPGIAISAQNVFDRPNGPFTGELSVGQLADAKIDWAIIGHSERRVLLREEDDVRGFSG
jgi:triosephosphate isomerase (TIM)